MSDPTHHEPPCYVSMTGLVRLPDSVIAELGLETGGGVTFIKNKDGKFEIWTTADVEEYLGVKE